MRLIVFINLILTNFLLVAQTSQLDSLIEKAKSPKLDTVKVKSLISLARKTKKHNPDSAMLLFNQALLCSEKIGWLNGIAEANRHSGLLQMQKGNFVEARQFFTKAVQVCEKIIISPDKNQTQEGYELMRMNKDNLAMVHFNQAEYDSALVYFIESLKLSKKTGNIKTMGGALGNIGSVYYSKSNYPMAIKFQLKSLRLAELCSDTTVIINTNYNIASIYSMQGENKKALNHYLKSIEISHRLGKNYPRTYLYSALASKYFDLVEIDKCIEYNLIALEEALKHNDVRMQGVIYGNLGMAYLDVKDYSKAAINLEKGLKIATAMADNYTIGNLYISLGLLAMEQSNYSKAEKDFQVALEINKSNGVVEFEKQTEKHLANLYEKWGKRDKAYEHLKKHMQLKDSLSNVENQKKLIWQEINYGFEKKKAISDKEHELEIKQKEEKAASEKAKQNIIIFSVSIMLIVVAVFSVFLYNRFKVTQKQKIIIELKERETHLQKEIIEEKHKEITDSINYAERIQRSFLATKDLLDENLNDYFILFKPKDVVSGDFYWASKLNNGDFAFVTADSTGHGVPGAIMSLLNITSLEKAIERTNNPAEILNKTRTTIIERLKKDGSKDGGKDGMDCSLILLNESKTKLDVAAANNPVWIIRNKEVIEIKPDKMPVGKHDKDQESFTLHEMEVKSGDLIYTLTDGFPDQFGGLKGKKFMSKRLKELLLQISEEPLQKQRQILEETFVAWVGDLEQIDDVTIVGIKI